MHLEGRDAVVKHLRAKFQQNREEPPKVGGWPESHPAASHGPEPGQTPAMASKGDPPQEPHWSRRGDCSRASPSHSAGQSLGQHSPRSACDTPAQMVCRKKGMVQDASFHPVPAKPGGDVLNKKVEASSDPPYRKPAQQTWPPAKDKGASAVVAKGAAVADPLLAVRSPQRTEHPALPQRKPLPHVRALGVKPGKPRRPPDVDLSKFRAAAHPGTSVCPATEPPRRAQLAALPNHAVPRCRGEDELYDDVEPVGLTRRSPGLLLPSVSQLPVYPCPRG
ncbi:hypothetical protein IHE44_0009901, partial [Lamprotornis superbus]